MADGELNNDQKQRIDAVVHAAEVRTQIEWCVILGARASEDPRREAERAFHKANMHGRPSILIMVTPSAHTLEIVVDHALRTRVTDQLCEDAVRLMTGVFATGDVVGGIEQGIQSLAERIPDAIPDDLPDDVTTHADEDLPNVVDLEE